MTEWTLDQLPTTNPEETRLPEVVGAPADAPYADLVADALIDDLELDLVDWFA